jgi:hypothetical protein
MSAFDSIRFVTRFNSNPVSQLIPRSGWRYFRRLLSDPYLPVYNRTVSLKGKTDGVLPDVAYRDIANQLDAVTSVRRGLAQARKGEGRRADEVFDELEREDANV